MQKNQTNEELAAAVRGGDREKMAALWEQVERFVARQASRVMAIAGGFGGGVDFDDLYQSGYLALVSAVETYDPERGKSFIGWLSVVLKNAFAEAAGRRTERQKHDPIHIAASLDAPIGDDEDGGTIVDLLPTGDPEPGDLAVESLYLQQLHDALEQAMNELTPRQASILRRRYYGNETLGAIAAALCCTTANVGDQERTALRRLYEARTVNGLSEFIETHTSYYQSVGPRRFQNTGTSAVEVIAMKREQLAEKWLKAHGITKGGGKT